MTVFARVARLGGFAAAARELHISTTSVSRTIGQLEEHLGARLLRRTTRQVSLTDAGVVYLERCERILADVQELEEALGEGQREPRGRLRISAGVSFAQEQLHTVLPAFVEQHPNLECELMLTDRRVDLVREGVDIAIRIGRLADSTLFARRLSPCRHAVCASPDYTDRHGMIRHPAELADHACIIDTNQPRGWWFAGPDGQEATQLAEGRYRVNSAHGACDAVLAGIGVAYLPTFVAGPRIERGELVVQLPGYRAAEVHVYAVYPESRYLSAGVRALIERLAEHFGSDPPWDRWRASAGDTSR